MRLMVLKKRMDQIKNSPEAVVAFGILNAIGMTPVQVESLIIKVFAMKGTAVMTNVPGPRKPIYFAGSPVDGVMFWVPQPGSLGMGVSILSYAGGVVLGIATDDCLVDDPATLIQFFQDEVRALKGWGQPKKMPVRVEWVTPSPAQAAEAPPSEAPPSEAQVTAGQKTPPADKLALPSPTANGSCQALTQSGRPCKNPALSGKATCRVHTL
jgi:hypothetical protein